MEKEAKLFISGTITAVKQGAPTCWLRTDRLHLAPRRDRERDAHGAPCRRRRPRRQGDALASGAEEGLEHRQHPPFQQGWSHSFISQHVHTQGLRGARTRQAPGYVHVLRQLGLQSFRASAPHTQDTTGSLRSQAAPGGGRERGAVRRRPRGWRGRRDAEGAGRQLPSLSTALRMGLRALSSTGPSGSSLHP